MKRTNTNFLLTVIIFLFITAIDIKAQITVVLKQPLPYQFKIENMWKVTLINPTSVAYKVYLTGTATESHQGEIVNATSAVFNLNPGVKVVNNYELVPMHIEAANSMYTDVVKNMGTVPTGDYEICVNVINAETGMQIGGQCMETQVFNLSEVKLLQPENKARFMSSINLKDDIDSLGGAKLITGSFITFTWLAPSPVPQGNKVTYSIKITEILGNQSAYDAINSNPAFYTKQNIYSNIFLYPVEGRNFGTNSRYAWQVDAYLNNVLISESEVWEFDFVDKSKRYISTGKAGEANVHSRVNNFSSAQSMLVASADESQILKWIYENENNDAPQPFLFSGKAKLSFDAGYKNLPFSEIPKNTFTAELSPSITIYGLPFTAGFLFSTQQKSDRQSINSFSFNFDINSYKEQIKTRLEKKVNETISGMEKMLLGIDAFGIGTNYPSYSEYTLSGVPVTGINLEVNPGIFYLAFAASNNKRGIENTAYQRSLFAGRIGLGKKDGTHFFLTGVYAKDNENSITVLPDNLTLTPHANYIFGAETKISMFDSHLNIEGEGNASVLTRDTRDAGLEIDAVPGFVKRMITPKISTSFDYSYAGKVSFNNTASATKISFGIKMVGPGYTSLGAPNLRSDQLAYEAKLDQAFLSKRISVGAFFKTSHDNLITWKSSTTRVTSFGVNMGLNFPSLPFIQFSYSPFKQKNDDANPLQKVDNKTTMISAVTGYIFMIDQFNFSTNVSYSGNEAKTLNGLSDYSTNAISVTEAVSFNNPLSFACTWGLIKTTFPSPLSANAGSPLQAMQSSAKSTINNFDFSVNADYLENLSNTLGINIESERLLDRKTSVYLSTSYTFLRNFNFNMRIETSTFKNYADSTANYNELTFNLVLNVNW